MENCNWICKECYPGGKDIGNIAGVFYLCEQNGQYFILAGQGHNGDNILTWGGKPFPDPMESLTDEQIDAMPDDQFNKAVFKAENILQKTNMKMEPYIGYQLVTACKEKGIYNEKRDGINFPLWLFHLCGVLINEYEKEDNNGHAF